jgi:putative transposase
LNKVVHISGQFAAGSEREPPLGMARPLRIQAPGLTYHINARGNGKMAIYRDDTDRRRFLEILAQTLDDYGLDCHAYCEMTTHYHLVATTADANLSKFVRALNGTYAQWWNHRHDHVGHVFQGRFGAQVLQDDSYLLTACRYVVLNPVRAHLVDAPEKWPWSSYRATAGLVPVPRYLRLDLLLSQLMDGNGHNLCTRYREFIAGADARTVELPSRPILGDPGLLNASRSGPRARVRRSPDVREAPVRP